MKHYVLPFTMLATIGLQAHASSNVAFSGYANFAVSQLESSAPQLPKFGLTENVDFSQGSLFALRVNADAGNGLFAASEIMSRGKNDFDVEMRWVYLGYKLSSSSFITVGNLRLPMLNNSDYLDVGMAYPTTTLPKLTYMFPDAYSGISLIQHFSFLNQDVTLQALTGNLKDEFGFTDSAWEVDASTLYGLSATFENTGARFRAGYFEARDSDVSISSEYKTDLSDAVFAYGGFNPIAKDKLIMWSAGFQTVNSQLIIDAEYAVAKSNSGIMPTIKTGTILIGFVYGNTTPYLRYERRDDEQPEYLVDGLAPISYRPYDASKALSWAHEQAVNAEAFTAGVRYDFHINSALKAEVTELKHLDPQVPASQRLLTISISVKF